jgi:hypothetical protein
LGFSVFFVYTKDTKVAQRRSQGSKWDAEDD